MEQKKAWLSKTMWLNGIFGVVAMVSIFLPEANMVKDFLTGHAAEVTMVWSILNMILRAVSKEKIVLVD